MMNKYLINIIRDRLQSIGFIIRTIRENELYVYSKITGTPENSLSENFISGTYTYSGNFRHSIICAINFREKNILLATRNSICIDYADLNIDDMINIIKDDATKFKF